MGLTVVPAKAGIQVVDLLERENLDSRFRGNDDPVVRAVFMR